MAIDWGIALGSGVQTGVNTYRQMQAQAMEDLKAKKLQQEYDEEQAFQESTKKQAATQAPTNGIDVSQAVDKGIQYDSPDSQAAFKNQLANLTPEQQQNALRMLKGSEVDVRQQASALPAEGTAQATPVTESGKEQPKVGLDLGKVQVYKGEKGETLASTESESASPMKIMRRVMDDMQASGNMAGYQKAAGIYKLAREVSIADATDKVGEEVQKFTAKFQDTMDKHGMVGAVEKLGSEFAKNGVNLSVIKDKTGKDVVAVLGADGKPTQTFSNPGQMSEAFQELMVSHAMNKLMFASGNNLKDIAEIMEKKNRGDYYKADILLKRELQPYQIEKLKAETDASRAHGAAAGNLGTPIGTLGDSETPVYKGGVTSDGKKVDPNAKITPWGQQKQFSPTITSKNVTIKDENGQESVMPIDIVTTPQRDGTFKKQYLDPSGAEITDPNRISQIHKADVKVRTVAEVGKDWAKAVAAKPEMYALLKPHEKLALKQSFFEDNGVAPDSAVALMRRGVRSDKTPVYREEYERFNEMYPLSKMPIPKNAPRQYGSAIPVVK